MFQVLERWVESHPSGELPGSVSFKRQHCDRRIAYGRELIFVSTSEHVWVEQRGTSASNMIFILMEDFGSCMLVKPNPMNNNLWQGYHGWLGADLGFTLQTIAQSGAEVRSPTAGRIEKCSDRPSANKEPAQKSCPMDKSGQEQSIAEIPKPRPGTTGINEQVTVKKEPSRFSIRQAALRIHRLQPQSGRNRWRFETPLASLDTVKKRRWPPQYVSPPPTMQHRKPFLEHNTAVESPETPVPQSSRHERCSTPELASVSPAAPTSSKRKKSEMNGITRDQFKTPSPKQKSKKAIADAQLPTPSSSSSPLAPQDVLNSHPRTNTILLFFFQRTELGAFPVPITQCKAMDQFFDRAKVAWDFPTASNPDTEMAGVGVEVEGIQWPMIVAWRDLQAYQWMMDTIARAAIGRVQDLHVQVKCIPK